MLVILSIGIASYALLRPTCASPLCTEEKLQECFDLLNKDHLPSATVLYFSEEVMTEHCRRYKIFSECMNTIRPYCSESKNISVLVYEGIDDAYKFVCGDGFKDYVKYQAVCYKEDDVQFEAQTCRDVFASRSNYLKNNVTDKKYATARYCQYVDDYVGCVYHLIRSFCGESAATWHKTYDTKTVQPVMVAFHCPGWPPATETPPSDTSGTIWVISLGAAIVVTGIVVAVGLSILICSRCNCRRRCGRRSVSVDMPPPYSGPPFTIFPAEPGDTSSVSTAPQSSDSSTDSIRRPCRSTRKSKKLTKKASKTSTPVLPATDASTISDVRRLIDDFDASVESEISRTGSSGGTVFEDPDESVGAVGGSPFVCPYTPTGHFEMPSRDSSILSCLQSSDYDTASLVSHACDYY